MKILYDHQAFSVYHLYSGISRYFCELMNHLSKDEEIEFELSILFSNNKFLEKADFVQERSLLKRVNVKNISKIISVINRQKSKRKLSEQNYDIFHPTYYYPYFLDYIEKKPFVLTVFDMIHEKYSAMIPANDKTADFKKMLIAKAAKIVAISENTKKDIIECYHIDENKIKVIYHANSLVKPDKIDFNINFPPKYLLYVGVRKLYKNFEFFIRSASSFLHSDENLGIVCVGIYPFAASEISLFRELNIQNKIFHYRITDDVLYYLYEHAIALVHPSLYEGFGIPVLESFACGCPVVLSNASSLPEVGGDAAVYFDPQSEASLKDALTMVLHDEQLRNTLKSKGYKQLEKFSWTKSAEETKDLYKSI